VDPGVLDELEAVGLIVLADKRYQGAAHAKVPYKGRNKPESQKEANKAHAKLAPPASARTRSSRPGGSSGSFAAVPGAPDALRKPSIRSRFTRHNQAERVHYSRKTRKTIHVTTIQHGPGRAR
jgi:hypothetical protein